MSNPLILNVIRYLTFESWNLESMVLGSFKEIDPVPFLQGNDRLLPVRPLPLLSTQPLHLAENVGSSNANYLDLKEALNG